ncbi:NAD(P)-dependent alcohol dehydrogenase [Lentilitoribacter sp. EG35]|uniref:NAD(P)-dependent alcohol dehydrogenase n=1 Tax=Lentilitoribacter sp. EG35 TaxID=3234192 RepID=UPI00345F87DD
MQAITYSKYGGPDVVQISEVPTPIIKDDQVLIKVHAASVSSGDWRARSLILPKGFGLLGRLMFGIFGPRKPILGTELSGTIEAIGASVKKFKIGDAVVAFPDISMGAHAQYCAMKEDGLIVKKPHNLNFAEAASLCFGGTTALSFLRDKCGIQPNEKVLIIGASGSTGSAAVQIAKSFDAEVTGICGPNNVALVQSIGADHVIDYTKEDFTKNGETYDIILNCNGEIGFSDVEHSLAPRGRLGLILGNFKQLLGLERAPKKSGKKVIPGVAMTKLEDLELLAKLAENGKYKPLIGHTFDFEAAQEAHAMVDTGHKRGNVVLIMQEQPSDNLNMAANNAGANWHPFT